MSDTPFESVSEALRYAYEQEGRDIIQRDSTFSRYQSAGTVRLAGKPYWEALSPWDRAGIAGRVTGAVERHLYGDRKAAVLAFYLPSDRCNEGVLFRKQSACAALIPAARAAFTQPPKDERLALLISAWAGLEKVDFEDWANELGVSRQTVFNWRYGRRGYGNGVNGALDALLDDSRRLLGNHLRNSGLIP